MTSFGQSDLALAMMLWSEGMRDWMARDCRCLTVE